jgi:hypothetical protein
LLAFCFQAACLHRRNISHAELTRSKSDPAILVKENGDGSVTILSNEKIWHRYFGEDNNMASYTEFMDFIKGLYEPIADHMGAKQ